VAWTPATDEVVDPTVGAAADPSVCVAVSPVSDGVEDSAVDAAADLTVGAADAPAAGGVVDPTVGAVADTGVGKASDPTDRMVAALTLDELADFTTCTVANFILTEAACPALGVTDDTTFDVVVKEEIDSVGNGNENMRISNLKKKNKNMRRIAEMR
jgi:hypothetical protein